MDLGQCSVCHVTASLKCAGCNQVFYCGKSHQKQHWKDHKPSCSKYKVVRSDTLGRYLIATKDIIEGEIIFEEKPLVVGPKASCAPVCLGCHRTLKPSAMEENEPLTFYKCPDCGWPLCAPRCKKLPSHQKECKVMKDKKYLSNIEYESDSKKEPGYCCIAPLRCLLLDKAQLDQLLTLDSHLNERINSKLYEIYRTNVLGFIKNRLMMNVEEELVLRIAGILDTNTFDIRRRVGNIRIRGIYMKAAMLSHNCKPNTKHVIMDEDFTFQLRALVKIKKGEIISTTYTQTFWGTLDRRLHLKMSKCFDCTCDRCQNPTEYETYLGGILCSRCKNHVISTNPLDNVAKWKCIMCSHSLSAKQIAMGNESIKSELATLDKTQPEPLERFLEKFQDRDSVLHARNQHIVQAKLTLLQIYEMGLEELSEERLLKKINISKDLLDVLSILEPGITKLKAKLLYDLQAGIVLLTKIQYEQDQLSLEEAKEKCEQAMDYLAESTEIIKTEPDLSTLLIEKAESLSKIFQ
uniref:Protein msta, isoform A n=1 Tax=Cacopsylla melanoneura TaxID=428564 RepID=A0A8D8V3U5_9HEMI